MRVCPRCQLKYPDDETRCFVDGLALEQAADENIGKILAGRYLVEQLLGEGGMATVYRARHTLVDRPVAVKIMGAHLIRDRALRERFRREAKNAAALAHPNIIEIFDYGETDGGAPFVVMELLDGFSLQKLIDRGAIPAPLVAALGYQIASGIARAHDFQVLHRDLKPDNVFIVPRRDGGYTVKLLDFGIARSMHDPRLTNQGEMFGTPQYMAPERVASIDAGPSADLYALGVILFEMVTGRLPFDAQDVTGFLVKHMHEPPPRPSSFVADVPRRLEELIMRLLAKRPEERPVDAHQVMRELGALVPAQEPVGVVPQPSPSARTVAPTLRPATLELWARRAVVFDQMLRRAYPHGNAPDQLVRALGQLRGYMSRIHDLRHHGLREQRKLDVIETNAREGRERLGRAQDTLGVDLSQAREIARQARHDVERYLEGDREGEAAFHAAQQALFAATGGRAIADPSAELVAALRDAAEALDRWLLARGAADKARRWIGTKDRDVEDLDFQVAALRGQLARLETDIEHERRACESVLEDSGREMERLEHELLHVASHFCEALRPHRELGDLFAELEGTRSS